MKMNRDDFDNSIRIEPNKMLVDKQVNNKREQKSNFRALKIIAPIAAFVLVIGVANFLGIFDIDNLFNVGREEDNVGVVVSAEPTVRRLNGTLTEIPKVVTKSIFDGLMYEIPNTDAAAWAVRKLDTYYTLTELDNGWFYVLDPNVTRREKDELLGYWNEFIGWDDLDYIKMIADYNMSEYIRDPYSHVRFGRSKDILLLELEWHTAESYAEEFGLDKRIARFNETLESEWFLNLSDEIREAYITDFQEDFWIERVEAIREGRYYEQKTVNGLTMRDLHERAWSFSMIGINSDNKETADLIMANSIDNNGYYIYKVYPQNIHISYADENHAHQWENFGVVQSKREFDNLLGSTIIPFLDDLLERGLIRQEMYDWQILDPLEKAVRLYFGTR